MTDFFSIILLICCFGLLLALLLGLYERLYGPLAWAEDTDVFALMEQWIFHPIGRQVHKIYPIYEDPEPISWSVAVDEIESEATPDELRQLENARDFYYEPVWDWPIFRLEKRPWDYEWDGL